MEENDALQVRLAIAEAEAAHKLMREVRNEALEAYDKFVNSSKFNLGETMQLENLITAELCMEAVKHEGYALQYVPENLITKELCLAALQNNPRSATIGYVPEKLRTAELCMVAVKNRGASLHYVPENMKTMELCMTAVKNAGFALKFVPENMKTEELCMVAVKNDGYALKFVPENLKTEEMCRVATQWFMTKMKEYGENFDENFDYENIPESLKTAELCMEAVKNYGGFLKYVPENMKTAELCMTAVQNYGYAIRYVPKNLMTAELCMEAVKKGGSALGWIIKKLKPAEEQIVRKMTRVAPEQEKIADSVFDSVYLKLLEENSTAESVLQMMFDAGLNNENFVDREHMISGVDYFSGKLVKKVTSDFLEEKYDYQKFLDVCAKLKDIYAKLKISCTIFYTNFTNGEPTRSSFANFAEAIKEYATNVSMTKIMQNDTRYKQLFEIASKWEEK